MQNKDKFNVTDVLLFTMIIIWAVNPIAIKSAESEIKLGAFIVLRLMISAICLAMILWLSKEDFRINLKDIVTLSAAGLIGVMLYAVFYMTGLQYTSVSNSAIMMAVTPICVSLLNFVFLKEKLSVNGYIGVFITFVGVIFIISNDAGLSLKADYAKGDLLIFCSMLCLSVYVILTTKLFKKYSPLKVTAYSFIIAAIPATFIWGNDVLSQDWASVTVKGWGSLLFTAILGNVIAYLLWNIGTKRIGGARTSLYQNIKPILTTIIAVILINEKIGWVDIAGALFILVGLHMGRTSKLSSVTKPAN